MKSLPSVLLCLLACLCLPLQAKELTDYRVGEIAETDITTPVALDVINATATAALQSSQAQQYPSIFRSFPAVTNEMTREFLAVFARARTNFQTEVTNEFHAWPVDQATIASPNFSSLVTAFGVENKNFPITDGLAAEWARGNDGQDIREKLMRTLLGVEGRRICPDVPPRGMVVGKAFRVVPVATIDERLPLETVQQGETAPSSSLLTVSNAQAIFRREFPPQEQLFARAVAAFIKPNCLPDAPLTQLTRGTAVCQLVVSDHYDAGDAIVRSGATIDTKIKAALVALSEKLKAVPPTPQAPPAPAVAVAAPQPRLPAHPESSTMLTARAEAQNSAPAASRPPLPHKGLILGLAAASLVSLMVACWQYFKQKRRAATATSMAQVPLPFPGSTNSDLAPQVTQAVREAVHQELASQRRELLVTQQAATDEITSLVHRLDELHVPLQERLHTYETRIQTLEKELAVRNEENRQLLKMKIEMISRQMESERAANLITDRSTIRN